MVPLTETVFLCILVVCLIYRTLCACELWAQNKSLAASKPSLTTQARRQMMMHTNFLDGLCLVFREPLQHVFNPKSLIVHPSPPPPPQQLLSLAQSWRISVPTETSFYLLPQQVKTSMDHSLKPNTSVLKCFFPSDKPHQHARALYSHTESSGGGECVQSTGVGGLLGREGSTAGWGHSGSVCRMTNERFIMAQHDCLAWMVCWRRTRLVWFLAPSWPVLG